MIKFIRHRAGPGRLLGLTRNVGDTMVRGMLRNYRHSSTVWLSTPRHTRGVGTGQAGSWTTDTIYRLL